MPASTLPNSPTKAKEDGPPANSEMNHLLLFIFPPSLLLFFHLHSLDPHSVISQPNVIVVLEEEDGTGTLLSEVKQLVKSIREIRVGRSLQPQLSSTFLHFSLYVQSVDVTHITNTHTNMTRT